MPYGLIHFFPGGTKEQYEATVDALHPSRSVLPKGQIYHFAGPSAGGWTIVAVHETKETWETFRDLVQDKLPGIDLANDNGSAPAAVEGDDGEEEAPVTMRDPIPYGEGAAL